MKYNTLICKHCNQPFLVKNSSKQQFCSKNCASDSRKAIIKTYICEFCNKIELLPAIKRYSGDKHFCNRECYINYLSYKQKNIEKVERNVKTCKNCNKEFRFIGKDKIYCSKSCYFKHKEKKYICKFCNKEFNYNKSNTVTYCSKQCKTNSVIDKKNKSIIVKNCLNCNKEFKTSKFKPSKFCGKNCIREYRNSDLIFKCKKCGKEFTAKKWEKNKSKNIFCSKECYFNNNPKQILKCECGKEFQANPSRIKYYNKLYCSQECYHKYSNTTIIYFGNIDKKYELASREIRSKGIYYTWRKSCLERDNFKCIKCNSNDNLTVHHKIPMWKFIDKHNFIIKDILNDSSFFDISIGETLCRKCHITEHRR